MTKQQTLAAKYHSCTCPESLMAINWMTTKTVDVDFEDSNNQRHEARIVWVSSSCLKCKETILHGRTFCDFRITGPALREQAIVTANEWISGNRRFSRNAEINYSSRIAVYKIWKKYHPNQSITA